MENFSSENGLSKDRNLIKNSFDKLINLFYPENRIKQNNNSLLNFNHESKKPTRQAIVNSKISKKNKSFLNQNFCNEQCQIKFQKILSKIKNGQIDINKINWWQQEGHGYNLIQNLVNYYYNIGYNQGISELQQQNKNN
jgi:hypothetical protein